MNVADLDVTITIHVSEAIQILADAIALIPEWHEMEKIELAERLRKAFSISGSKQE